MKKILGGAVILLAVALWWEWGVAEVYRERTAFLREQLQGGGR